MDEWYGLIEMILVFAVILGWAVRELISVRRAQRTDREDGRDPS
ncbi:hypothetical protein [Prosthecomicrobium sp. N25]